MEMEDKVIRSESLVDKMKSYSDLKQIESYLYERNQYEKKEEYKKLYEILLNQIQNFIKNGTVGNRS